MSGYQNSSKFTLSQCEACRRALQVSKALYSLAFVVISLRQLGVQGGREPRYGGAVGALMLQADM